MSFATRDFLASLPWTGLAVVVALALTLVVALRAGKHSVIDVTWGLGFAAIAAVSFLLSPASGGSRKVLVLALTAAWGVRLALHIAARQRGEGEDPRYEQLLARATGSRTAHAVKRVYVPQGLIMWFVSLPVQVAMFQPGPLGLLGWLGVAVWAAGMVFEAVGDWQLQRFRDDPANKGKVMDRGLWRYTRHPNYFGDACVWWGLSLIAFAQWPGILTVLSPVVMTFLLVKGTGAALLESTIKQRRPGYEDYVRRTSGFVPLPPKRAGRAPL